MVGLTIEVDLPFWRRSMGFLFGRQDASALERFGYLAHAAGLRMKVVEMDRGRVRVPVVIAKRTLD
jgi:hypothetical protein